MIKTKKIMKTKMKHPKMLEDSGHYSHKKSDIFYWIIFFVMSILVFCISIRHIDVTQSLIGWDELGYWSNAAYIAGYDWSSAATEFCGYYSYGYSVLVAILLMIFRNGGRTYQAAIFLNGLFMTGNFILLNQIGNQIFGVEKKWYVLCSTLIVSFYTNNLCQSCWAWPECEIIFLYTSLVYLFISIEKKYKLHKLLTICLLLIYLFIVHPRTIGIVIAGIIIVVIFCLLNKMPTRDLYTLLSIIGIIGMIALYYRNIIKHGVYLDTADENMSNTISVVPDMMKKFNSWTGIINLLKTFANRFLYWGITTFSTCYIVMFCYIKHVIQVVQKKSKPRIDYAFIALSILGVFGVMTIHLSSAGTYQALLYGRYQDIVVCPIFLIGLMLIITHMDPFKTKIIFMAFPIMVTLLLIAKSIPIYSDYFVINCNTNMYKYWIGTNQGGYEYYMALLISGFVLILIWMIANIHIENVQRKMLLILTIIMCVSFYKDSEKVFNASFSNYMDMQGVYSEIHNLCEGEAEIYFYKDSTMFSVLQPLVMGLQLEMFDKRIIVIEDLEDIPPNNYLIYPRTKQGDEYITSAPFVGQIVLDDKFIILCLTE